MSNEFNAYYATLIDCRGVSESECQEAEKRFCKALNKHFFGEKEVINKYLKYIEVFDKYGETPLPKSASDEEMAIVDEWEFAENVIGEGAAFAGWLRNKAGAHFEITVYKS